MVQACAKCRRTNPRDANYCYYDGNVLDRREPHVPVDGSAVNLGARPFTTPFVFPSGRECDNFQQLAEACHEQRSAAAAALRDGHLTTFLAGQGRTDLAAVARFASRAADPERGLDDLLGRLPFVLPAARLRIEPGVIDAGTVHVGEDRALDVMLSNDGMRLLYGTAASVEPWLSLSDGARQTNRVFQFADQAVLPIRIIGSRLHAFDKPQESVIHLESSGGTGTVTVRVMVPIKPFPDGALAGTTSPRELAEEGPRRNQGGGGTHRERRRCPAGIATTAGPIRCSSRARPASPRCSSSSRRSAWSSRRRWSSAKTPSPCVAGPAKSSSTSWPSSRTRTATAIAHGVSDQPWLHVGKPVFRGRSAFMPLTVAAVPASGKRRCGRRSP